MKIMFSNKETSQLSIFVLRTCNLTNNSVSSLNKLKLVFSVFAFTGAWWSLMNPLSCFHGWLVTTPLSNNQVENNTSLCICLTEISTNSFQQGTYLKRCVKKHIWFPQWTTISTCDIFVATVISVCFENVSFKCVATVSKYLTDNQLNFKEMVNVFHDKT